jgi:hypothetical protein
LGRDLGYFDDHIVDRVMGTPARTSLSISSLVQLEKKILGTQSEYDPKEFSRGHGLAGKLFQWTADLFNWFEDRLVLRGIGIDAINMGRDLGYAAIKFEKLILKPRYLVVFVAVVLLLASAI